MKKIITIVAALSAIGLAAPAVAQDRHGNDRGYGYDRGNGYANGNGGIQARTDQLQRRIQVGIQRGTISRQEAAYLRDGFRQLNRLEWQYGRDGLSRNEARALRDRIEQLQHQIQVAERSRDDRYGRDDSRDGRDWRDDRGSRDGRNDGDRRWDDRDD